eukprot:Phypoly_transcript_20408.p1 GENE.Phypoly_transcript_20408~~Phypoly_transcript_20408.p1  ORF type:complete len:165 (-),score=11.33 Phypoly_transcript_20408:142-636(-)
MNDCDNPSNAFYYKTAELNNRNVLLNILDLGRDDHMSMLIPYCSSGVGFLIVYSLADRESLGSLFEWYALLMKIRDEFSAPIVLAGTKSDLTGERKVEEEGREFAKSKDVPYFEVSALTGENVQECFEEVIQQADDWIQQRKRKQELYLSRQKNKSNSSTCEIA